MINEASGQESPDVYLMEIKGGESRRAICLQTEWEEMERLRPGHQCLIRADIGTEAEAELLARGSSAEPPERKKKEKPSYEPPTVPPLPA